MIQILHHVASLAPQSGGPARSITALADSLAAKEGYSVTLLSQTLYSGVIITATPNSQVDRQLAYSHSKLALKIGWPLKHLLDTVIPKARPVLLHDHGLWTPGNYYIASAARRFQIPLVIHLHGMLEPWALKYRGYKKRWALKLYQRRNLETAVLLFATAEQEAENIRKFGLHQPIAIIPNGIELALSRPNKVLDEQTQSSSRIALFLGRIHPIKGLLNLVEAWGRIRPTYWRLCLAGPDEGGYLAVVMRRIRELNLEATIEYVGEVEGDTKAALLTHAELFILPTFSENFGIVVAEALSYGLPVITTHGAPWKELMTRGCGWWIEPTTEALTLTLREALNMTPSHLQAMGNRGFSYAQKFNWTHIAQQTIEVYRWILGQGPMPACVLRN